MISDLCSGTAQSPRARARAIARGGTGRPRGLLSPALLVTSLVLASAVAVAAQDSSWPARQDGAAATDDRSAAGNFGAAMQEAANQTLLQATSPFEDMIEFALMGDDMGIREALSEAEREAPSVNDVLPADASNRYDALLHSLDQASGNKQYQTVATTALEAYRLLLDGLKAGNLQVPKEVSLLDYAGFRLRVLAHAPEPDWTQMRETAEQASMWWGTIASRVSNQGLRDAFSSVVAGLQEATEQEDLTFLRFAAKMDLDLVDLLEESFRAR